MIGISMKTDTEEQLRYNENEIKDKIVQELNKIRYENAALKENLVKVTRLLYNFVDGVEKINNGHFPTDDYFVSLELLMVPELEIWYNEHKAKLEEERLRLLRLNALNKLSNEEKKALGLI